MAPNYREELEDIIDEWSKFRKSLRGEDRDHYDSMIKYAKRHVTAGVKQNNPRPMETFLMSIILEQEIEIQRLMKKAEHRKADLDDY